MARLYTERARFMTMDYTRTNLPALVAALETDLMDPTDAGSDLAANGLTTPTDKNFFDYDLTLSKANSIFPVFMFGNVIRCGLVWCQ